ncbi:MAG TPA: NADH-quinone oxidoreductase subunit M [Opitutaceae bacterium]|jgi:NADH-quinone oxidoreductase subunit M|nr:NADH-quinone oxidoreductase subunit M [Opitutaceae bacterium]
MNTLPSAIYLCFAGSAAALVFGRRSAALARRLALAFAVAAALVVARAALDFAPAGELRTLTNAAWVPALGIRYHLAVDGISLTLAVLTAIAAIAGILFSWNVTESAGEFFALYLALLGAVYGVFLSENLFTLFVFYEIAIIPKYFLIARWGGGEREFAAMKLVLYSFAGSALVLAGLLWASAASGAHTFELPALAAATRALPGHVQVPLFALVFVGFATLAGLFPLHSWAPDGHVAAPTAASMLLAGVVMKLGAYGCLRVALPLFPAGFHALQGTIAVLAVIGILYAALVALVQSDFKRVVGFSSVSHMGFVLLGVAAGTPRAVAGAVLQMFSHGVLAGLLFGVVGRMVYDRTHTRDLASLRMMGLGRLLPFAAASFAVAGFASMGMPGFSGFPAELMILIGTWRYSPALTLGAVIGIVLCAAFTLRALQAGFLGGPPPAGAPVLPPITWPEKAGTCLLVAASVAVGLHPSLLLDWIEPALHSALFLPVWPGAAP